MESNAPNQLQTAPGSIPAMVLGILSIVLACFFGVGIVLGIIALILASKAIKAYKANPSVFTKGSFDMAKAGQITGIVGLCIAGIYLIFLIISVIIGTTVSGALFFLENF